MVVGVLANVLIIISYFCNFFKYRKGVSEVVSFYEGVSSLAGVNKDLNEPLSLSGILKVGIWIFVCIALLAILLAWKRKSIASMIFTIISLLPGVLLVIEYMSDEHSRIRSMYSFSVGMLLEVIGFIMAIVAARMPKEKR